MEIRITGCKQKDTDIILHETTMQDIVDISMDNKESRVSIPELIRALIAVSKGGKDERHT